MRVLGIETSCDETAAAIVSADGVVLSDVVHSQVSVHAPYGGVVPELASRDHMRNIRPVVQAALDKAGMRARDVDGVAVTARPGLSGALLVGVQMARGLAWALDKPLVAFGNHAMVNDGFLLSLYDLSQGPGVQVIRDILLSSPDHRGATGPLLFRTDLAIEYVGPTKLTVAAGRFDALHFRMVDVPGLPEAYPPYDLWCTADGDYVLLKATVGGYMMTAYELTAYDATGDAR